MEIFKISQYLWIMINKGIELFWILMIDALPSFEFDVLLPDPQTPCMQMKIDYFRRLVIDILLQMFRV